MDGAEARNLLNQLFATTSDFSQFGPVNSGVYTLTTVAGPTSQDELIQLRNNYNALFAQDDWKIKKSLILNLGLRWDYDSRFPNSADFSPRVGLAWSPNAKTVLSANWGIFYDNFRMGLARDIPGFGGADLFRNQTVSFPRLFYGDPSSLPRLLGLCASPALTDAEIAASGTTCPAASLPLFGIDHLNSVVACGHSTIPLNAVVTQANVQDLSGLSAQQFADAASAAVGRQPGFFFLGWIWQSHDELSRIANLSDPDHGGPRLQDAVHAGISLRSAKRDCQWRRNPNRLFPSRHTQYAWGKDDESGL